MEYVERAAAGYGLTYTILRPTAYFKDFTDFPWQRMQVLAAGGPLAAGWVQAGWAAGLLGC